MTAAPGKWQVGVRADTLPGGAAGVPLRKTYDVTLEPGKDVTVGARTPGGGGSGGTNLALPLTGAAVLAAIVGWFVLGRRRRTRFAPARRQPLA